MSGSYYYPPTVDLRSATERDLDAGRLTECDDCGIPYSVGGRHRCPMSESDWFDAGYRDGRRFRNDPPAVNGSDEFDRYMQGREAAGFDMHSKGL